MSCDVVIWFGVIWFKICESDEYRKFPSQRNFVVNYRNRPWKPKSFLFYRRACHVYRQPWSAYNSKDGLLDLFKHSAEQLLLQKKWSTYQKRENCRLLTWFEKCVNTHCLSTAISSWMLWLRGLTVLITIVICPWYQEICANFCCARVHCFV